MISWKDWCYGYEDANIREQSTVVTSKLSSEMHVKPEVLYCLSR